MNINKVIRKYRKEAKLTQEQLAICLGVSAPAVNKWENGISYPDITLLSPLARVLKINVDTLLSFNEELTDKEIDLLVNEIVEMAGNVGYQKAYQRGAELIKEYSTCDRLILSITSVLDCFLAQGVENQDGYEAQILLWYELIATSEKPEIASMATASLVSKYTNKQEFKKAQQLIDLIPSVSYDKQFMQAKLFKNQGKNEEAYEIYERMLLKNANELVSIIQLIIRLLVQEEAFNKTKKYVDLGKEVVRLFDLGAYSENTIELFLAIERREIEKSLEILEQMVAKIETISDFRKSDLYTHIKFREPQASDFNMVKSMLKRGLESDEESAFLKGEPRFKAILKTLDS